MSITREEFYSTYFSHQQQLATLKGEILRFLGEHKEHAFTAHEIRVNPATLFRKEDISLFGTAIALLEQNNTIERREIRGQNYYIMGGQ